MTEGRLEAIWLKRAHRGPMDAVSEAHCVAHRGLTGNADQGGKRQITVIEREVWEDLMRRVAADPAKAIAPAARRANLMVSGIRLAETRGRTLVIGECRILIHGETKPCERMDAALLGLTKAMWPDWQGGAFGEPLLDGRIAIGDAVRWLD
jgi:MOSC domain-containing protein YiiM